MAGWTTNRQAKRPPQRRRASLDAPLAGTVECSSTEALTLDAMLAARCDLTDDPPSASSPYTAPPEQLTRLVEAEIIPRLMLLHRASPRACPAAPLFEPHLTHVMALSQLAVHGEAQATVDYVRGLVQQGATHEQVLLDLLAASARYLGRLWEEDRCSFSEVTIGLWRLQRVLHDYAHLDLPTGRLPPPDAGRCLLAAVPGSQHTFGLSIVGEFFSRGGWEVDCHPQATWPAIQAHLAREHVDVFGLSVSSEVGLDEVLSAILDTRKTAANPRLFVMVGGPMAALMPDLAKRCGADAMASDAPTAVALADASLLARSQRSRRRPGA